MRNAAFFHIFLTTQQGWKLVSFTLQHSQMRSFYFLSKIVAKAPQQLTDTNLIKIFIQNIWHEILKRECADPSPEQQNRS